MPIENEFKYVLEDDDDMLRGKLRRRKGVVIERIHQGYLSKGVRLRRIENVDSEALQWMFTFKRKVGKHLFEIETEVTSDDFEALWPTCETYLAKTRYKFGEAGIHWDVDYFGKPDNHYFVMAEAEMPKRRQHETTAPPPCPLIAPNVLYIVGKDQGFSSRRLCNKEYAKELLGEIKGIVAKAHKKSRKSNVPRSPLSGEDLETVASFAA